MGKLCFSPSERYNAWSPIVKFGDGYKDFELNCRPSNHIRYANKSGICKFRNVNIIVCILIVKFGDDYKDIELNCHRQIWRSASTDLVPYLKSKSIILYCHTIPWLFCTIHMYGNKELLTLTLTLILWKWPWHWWVSIVKLILWIWPWHWWVFIDEIVKSNFPLISQ